MRFRMLACAALVTAALAATSAAEAGGGKRLDFGFPLGSFSATPAKGGGASKAYASKARKGAAKEAARKAEPKPSRVAKADRTTEPAASGKPPSEKAETTTAEEAAPRLTGSSALVAQPALSETGKAEPGTPDVAAPADGKSAEAACTRFVPALGTTVPVECGK